MTNTTEPAKKASRKNHHHDGSGSSGSSASTDSEQSMTDEEMALRDAIVPALMEHAYHLPGNGYVADLYQYMTNNHPVFGICFHHRYHPLGFWVRIACLVGSALFGLAVTNIIYLAFVFTNIDYDQTYVAVPATNMTAGMIIASTIEQSAPASLSITNGNIALWTIGSTIHALYDNTIWKLAACSCCMKAGSSRSDRQQRYKSFGTLLVVLSVVGVVALTTFAVAMRNALSPDDDDSDSGMPDDAEAIETINNVKIYKGTNSSNPNEIVLMQEVDSTKDLEFMVAYCIELALNYFIYFPIVGLILFSGVASCGRTEFCGGRPYEVRKEQEEFQEAAAAAAASSSSKTKATAGKKNSSTAAQPPKSSTRQQTTTK